VAKTNYKIPDCNVMLGCVNNGFQLITLHFYIYSILCVCPHWLY